jgi:hypothetical protein
LQAKALVLDIKIKLLLEQAKAELPAEIRAHDPKSPVSEHLPLDFELQMADVDRDCRVMSLLADRLMTEKNQKVRSVLLKEVHDRKLKVHEELDAAVKSLDEFKRGPKEKEKND